MSDPARVLKRFDELIEQGERLFGKFIDAGEGDRDLVFSPGTGFGPEVDRCQTWKLACRSFLERSIPQSSARDEVIGWLAQPGMGRTPEGVLSLHRNVLPSLGGLREAWVADVALTAAPLTGEARLAEEIERLALEGEALGLAWGGRSESLDSPAAFMGWQAACIGLIDQCEATASSRMTASVILKSKASRHGRDTAVAVLRSFKGTLTLRASLQPPAQPRPTKSDPLRDVRRLCDRFDLVARQLREQRRKDKETGEPKPSLHLKDEYDVQYLMHALLKIHFDDVRPEDHQSWRGGSTSRIDFVLGGRGVVIELKHTRDKLDDSALGKELSHDIELYHDHPECKTLVFFVYDPGRMVKNPAGMEKMSGERTREGKAINVVVLVRPRG